MQHTLGVLRVGPTAVGEQVRPPPPRAPTLALLSVPLSPYPAPESLCRRDYELTRAPCAQSGHAERVDGRVGRCRSWRATSSASSRSLSVSPALSTRATGSSMRPRAHMNRALTSFSLRAGQSSPRWHPLPFSSRKLVSSLAGHLTTAPLDAHRVSLERNRAQAAERCPSRCSHSSRRPSEPSRRGRVLTRPHPPSRATEGRGCTLVSR